MRSMPATDPFVFADKPKAWNFIDRTGQKFGRLLVQGYVGKAGQHVQWGCLCECGMRVVVFATNLQKGNTTSCGCVHSEVVRAQKTRHGHASKSARSSEYACHQTMLARCYRQSSEMFPHYGGRGIKVCDRWRLGEGGQSGFECFLADMGQKPSRNLTIERRDNDGNYEPGNCYWATAEVQANNKSTNVFVEYQGERLTVSQMARRHGLNCHTFADRLRAGKSVAEAIQPVRH